MHVKTLIRHANGYGPTYLKEPGDVYDHPNPDHLILAKMVKKHADRKNRRIQGDGTIAVPVEKRDGQEHGSPCAKKSAGADKEDGGETGSAP